MVRFGATRMLVLLSLGIAIYACSGSGSTTTSTVYPAPFNSANGEGELISANTVTTYSTSAASNPSTSIALDSYYTATICPIILNEAQCAQNKTNLSTPEFGNFNLGADPIANNPLGIKQVNAVKITYGVINVGGAAVTVWGGIVIPELAAGSIKGIVLYFHGMTVQRTNVPSTFVTPSNPFGNGEGILLAALWASQGYVVVMPDYIGLGDDTADLHPFVIYPQQNAQSGLAMVNAARSYLASTDNITGRLPLFLAGYSEGAPYALDAGRIMQGNPRYASTLKVDLTEAVPISGPFDLTGTMTPYLFDNITVSSNHWFSLDPNTSAVSKPYLSALLLSFANYAGVTPTDIVVNAFYSCIQSDEVACGTSGNLNGLFFESNIDAIDVALIAAGQATHTTWSTSSNSIEPLMTPVYSQALMEQDQKNALYAQLLQADAYLFIPAFPVALVSFEQDSIVTRKNTDVVYAYLTGQNPGGPYQELLVNNDNFVAPGIFSPGPIDHMSELPFLAVLALNQFNTAQ